MGSLSSRSTLRATHAHLPGPAQAGFRPAAAALAVAAAFAVHALPASAQPVPQAVIHGGATFARNGGNLTVTTTNGAGTNHSAINWSSFSVPAGSVTRFIQPSAGSTSINRVVEANPSRILGQLASNGRLVLVNPWGITVGPGAQVDTAGFTASTLAMSESDAIAGRLRFGGGSGGLLQVDGAIKVQGGDVVLIAPQVRTGASAVVEADGAAVLAAGRKVEITGRGLEGILMEVQAGDSAVHLGSLKGDAVAMFAGTLRHRGLVTAQAVSTEGGKVVLKAAGDAIVDGAVTAKAGDRGGRIDVLGERVGLLSGAALDASGAAGGGRVRVGGDYQGANADVPNAKAAYVDANAAIHADATQQGDGGRVIVWSDENTRMAGRISARGGAQGGNGGFAEVSGKDRLQFSGRVDLRAPRGATGKLLLDPNDLVISGSQPTSTFNVGSVFSDGPDLSYVSTVDLNAQLELGDVLLSTSVSPSTTSLAGGTITLASDATVAWGAATTLTLHANKGISLAGTVNATHGGSTLHLLTDQGSITQTAGSVRVGSLLAQASGGDVQLDQANHVGVVAGVANADTGRFVFRNNEDVTVGSVSAPSGSSNGIDAATSGGGVEVRSDAGSVRVRSNVSGGSLLLEAAQDVEVQGYVSLTAGGQAKLQAGRDVLLGAGRTEDPAIAVEHGSVTVTGATGLTIGAGRNVRSSGHGFDLASEYDNDVGLSGNGGSTGGVAIQAAGDVDFGARTLIATQRSPVSVTATGGSILGLVSVSTGGTADGSIKLQATNGSASFDTLDAQGTGSETPTAKGGDVTVNAKGNIEGTRIDSSGVYHSVDQPDSSGGNISVVSSAGSISLDQVNADGGSAAAGTTPGNGGNILLHANGDLTVATVSAISGASSDAAAIAPVAGSVSLVSDVGNIHVGTIDTYGGYGSSASGGDGGTIDISALGTAAGTGSITVDYALESSGGHSYASAGTVNGGRGGAITLLADKDIRLGGTFVGDATTPTSVSIRLNGGSAQSGTDLAGAGAAAAQFRAVSTQGSIAVTGSIEAIGGSGATDGGDGGHIVLQAQGTGAGAGAVTVDGYLQFSGGHGYAGNGGQGGSVFIRADKAIQLEVLSGDGGLAYGTAGSGGRGGSVDVTSQAGDVNLGDVYVIGRTGGTVTAASRGGNLSANSIAAYATSNGVPETGGNGGTVSLEALSTAAEAGNITVTGAIDAEGSWASANPGSGGTVTVAAFRNIVTSSVRAYGGWIYTPSSESSVVTTTSIASGGSGPATGGTISIDSTTGDITAVSLDVSGQQGGAITVRAHQGNIVLDDATATASSASTSASAPLPGGTITLEALGTAADRGNITVAGNLQSDGAYGYGGPAGAGGVVSVHADKNISLGGVNAQGGSTDAATLNGGDGGSVSLVSDHGNITVSWMNVAGGWAADGNAGRGGSVLLQALGTGGTLSVSDIDLSGGGSAQGIGGDGGTLTAQGDQLVTFTHISTRGGGSSAGAGGVGGTVSLSSTSGEVDVASGIDAGGGTGASGGRGGSVQVRAGGAVGLGSVWVDGGAATLAGGTAGNGGTVDIAAAGDIGNFGEGTSTISAGGGYGYPGAGGNGGTVRLASSGGSILTGSVQASGGSGAPGGKGGTVTLDAPLDIGTTVRNAGGDGSTYESAAGATGGDGGTATLRFGGSFTGSVDAQGGYGESGGTDNANGGAGGAGGVIDIARTTAGALQLQGLELYANGGSGGSALYGSTGVAGTGGKGGTIAVDAQQGALTLAQDTTTLRVNVLEASGGRGGYDSADNATTATGAAGMVTLHAAGDLRIDADALYLGDAITNFAATAGGVLQQNAPLRVEGGEVRLVADQLDLQGTVDTGSGRTVVGALTTGRAIRLGGLDDGSALHLSQDEINRITAGTLLVGDGLNTGGITVAGPISVDPLLVGRLSLVSGGAIAQAAGSPLAAQALNADGASVTLDTVTVGTLSGRAHAGGFTVANQGGGALTVGTVDGVNGIVAAGPVTLTADGALTLADSITGQGSGDAVALSATSLAVGAGAAIGTPSGRWLVYLPGPDGNQFGTLASGNYALWGRTFAANPPGTIAETGNRYLFATQPGVDIVADAATKVYDGGSSFNLTFQASGFIDASLYQNAFLQDSPATFSGSLGLLNATKNVGSYAIAQGTLASSYRINSFTSNTATITPATLSVSGLAALGKVYDGTTAATLQGSATVAPIGSDLVSVAGSAIGSFADKNAGTAKPVTVSGLSLTGADAGNYQIAMPAFSADITPASLTVSGLAALGKVYDATTFAALQGTAMVSPFGSDMVGLAGSAAGNFADKNVGTAKPVSVTGLALTGADAGNYALRLPTLAADITPATITLAGVVANSRMYDTTTAATLSGTALASGVLGSDAVTLSTTGMQASFADKNVGTGKAVTVSGVTLAGADAGNYVFVAPTGLSAAITPAPLAISGLAASDKVYDATTGATLTGQAGVGALAGDTVTLAGSAAGHFADKNVGSAKPVTVSGFSLTGADAGNYQLVAPTLSASITPAPLTVSGLAALGRVYDGTTFASVQGTATVTPFGGDVVGVAGSGSGSFADKNAGTGKPVSVTGFALAGIDAANYVLSLPTLAADITPAPVTLGGVVANSRVYDATTAATLSGAALASGVLGSDAVTLSTTGMQASFADKNVGTGKAVTVSGVALAGADAANYVFFAPTNLSADITPARLSVAGLQASDKVYDATTHAPLTGRAEVSALAGDTVALAGTATGSFADKNVGAAKPVTLAGLSLTGADAGNYVLALPTGLNADITPATVTLAGLAASDKVYDGTTSATLAGGALAGVLGSDAVSFTAGSASFADPNAGTAKAVTLAGAGLAGADAANYRLQAPATLSASITPRPLTIRPIDQSKNEGQLFTFAGTEFLPQKTGVGDETVASVSLSSAGAPAEAATGVYAIRAQGATGTNGFVAGNYAINYVDGALTVLASTAAAPVNNQVVTFATLFVEEARTQPSSQVKADDVQKKDDKAGNKDDIVVTGNSCRPS